MKVFKNVLTISILSSVLFSLLFVVIYFTEPIIKENNEETISNKYQNMYQNETISLITETQLNDPLIISFAVVKHSSTLSSIYHLISTSIFEEIEFYISYTLTNKSFEKYFFLKSNKPSKGSMYFQDNDLINNLYSNYNFVDNLIITSTTVTSEAINKSIKYSYTNFLNQDWSEYE